jgi:hypothetical protein
MKKPPLERVKELVQKFSPEELARLFEVLVDLPDSPVKQIPPPRLVSPPKLSPDEQNALKDIQLQYQVRNEEGQIIYSFEGREVFRLSFNAENYAEVFFEKFKTKEAFLKISDEQRHRVFQAVQDILKEEGMTITKRQLRNIESQALHELGLKLLKESLLKTARRMANSLPQVAAVVFPKVTQATLLAGANEFRDTLGVPEQKFSEAQIRNIVQGKEWEHLKLLMGITPPSRGGAHNVKHNWTDKDRECLIRKYEELQPMWLDAKVISREAETSRIKNRKTQWRQEVLRIYPNLPSDLLDGFSTLRGGTRPSDNAIIHASRQCGITPGISVRRLMAVMKEWKLKQSSGT